MQAQEQPEVDQEQVHHGRHEEGRRADEEWRLGYHHPPSRLCGILGLCSLVHPGINGRIQDVASQPEDLTELHTPKHLYDLPSAASIIPRSPRGVLANVCAHARPSAQHPNDMSCFA